MIKVEHINYIYQPGMSGERQALYDISMEIANGTLNALIGHTGSGKSTLIQHFNALVKPTSGRILIDGIDITDQKRTHEASSPAHSLHCYAKAAKKTDLREIRRRVGLVFQYPEHQLFEETVEKDIAFGPKNLGLSDEEVKERVISAAKMVGLKEKYLQKSPFELSGGQKRRAAIAGVLAMNPRVLILDEPTAGLDPRGRDAILDVIKNLHEENPEMIIIFVSHSMEDVAKTAEYVYVMNRGHLAMSGTTAEIFERGEELVTMGLNVPQITRLINKLREAGIPLPKDIYTVKYAVNEIEKLLR